MVEAATKKTIEEKNGRLLTSHRYNRLPLLPSGPGGVNRSWSCKTCQCKDMKMKAYPTNSYAKKSNLTESDH